MVRRPVRHRPLPAPEYVEDPLRRLALEVLAQAVRDMSNLSSNTYTQEYLDWLGLRLPPYEDLLAWIAAREEAFGLDWWCELAGLDGDAVIDALLKREPT